MALTAKKKQGKGVKSANNVHYNPRRFLYLLNYPITQLSNNQLPTVACVLRHYQYLKSPRHLRFKSSKSVICCSMKKGGKELRCKQSGNCEGEFNCVVSEVLKVWRKAGFENFIIDARSIRYLLLN